MENDSLDKKIEKPDWKQWIPVYGIYKVAEDDKEGKPTIATTGSAMFFGSAIYHGAAGVATVIGILEYLSR